MSKQRQDLLKKYNHVVHSASICQHNEGAPFKEYGVRELFWDTLMMALKKKDFVIAGKLFELCEGKKATSTMTMLCDIGKRLCSILVAAIENRDEETIRFLCEHAWERGFFSGNVRYGSMDFPDFQAFLIARAIANDISPSVKSLLISTVGRNESIQWFLLGLHLNDIMITQGIADDLEKAKTVFKDSKVQIEDYSGEVATFTYISAHMGSTTLSARVLRDIATKSGKNVERVIVAMIMGFCDRHPNSTEFVSKAIHSCFFESLEDERGAEVACVIAKVTWDGSVSNMKHLPVVDGKLAFDYHVLSRVVCYQDFSTLRFFWNMALSYGDINVPRLGYGLLALLGLAEERRKSRQTEPESCGDDKDDGDDDDDDDKREEAVSQTTTMVNTTATTTDPPQNTTTTTTTTATTADDARTESSPRQAVIHQRGVAIPMTGGPGYNRNVRGSDIALCLASLPEEGIEHFRKLLNPEIAEPDEEEKHEEEDKKKRKLNIGMMSLCAFIRKIRDQPVKCILETKSGNKYSTTKFGKIDCDMIDDDKIRIIIRNRGIRRLTDISVDTSVDIIWGENTESVGPPKISFDVPDKVVLDENQCLTSPSTNPIHPGRHYIRVRWRKECKDCDLESDLESVLFVFEKL